MKTNNWSLYLIILTFIIFGSILGSAISDRAYRRGQIDALTGKVNYQLVTKPDSTRVWEEINTK